MTWVYVALIAFAVSVCTQAGMFYLAKRAMRRLLAPKKTGKAAARLDSHLNMWACFRGRRV